MPLHRESVVNSTEAMLKHLRSNNIFGTCPPGLALGHQEEEGGAVVVVMEAAVMEQIIVQQLMDKMVQLTQAVVAEVELDILLELVVTVGQE